METHSAASSQPEQTRQDSCQSECNGDLSYDEVRGKRLYDWHNCNPMKVLLENSAETPEQPVLVQYVVGKEYLQNKLRFQPSGLFTDPSPAEEETRGRGDIQVPEMENVIDEGFSRASS